jgi:hypothetical protein
MQIRDFSKARDKDTLEVVKLEESGYNSALIGIALNKNKNPELMGKVALKLASLDGGHNKFLEFITTWWLVTAPRWFWQQADTYRHCTKSSQSTMHTIMDRDMEITDFFNSDVLISYLDYLNTLRTGGQFESLKNQLPEGYMQTRVWKMDYKTLRNIINQRYTHRMGIWAELLDSMLAQVEHPELLPSLDKVGSHE